MIRFLHTSDWQLGMTRHYLDPEAQARFSEARFEVIRSMAALCAEQDCAFVVVAGDVFETNQVQRRTVARTFDALEAFDVPVYLLPGNHDCLDPTSVYTRSSFTQRLPAHVHVLDDTTVRVPCEGAEVVGVPWRSKEPLRDLVAAALVDQAPPRGQRVVVAHGAVDSLSPDSNDPARIMLAPASKAIAQGHMHFLALGDRHSRTEVAPNIWYSGAPEPTAYVETDPGDALVVELRDGQAQVHPHRVGVWKFHRLTHALAPSEGVEQLARALDEIQDKRQAIVKLALQGSASLTQWTQVEALLDNQRDLFAALEQPARHRDVAILPADADFEGHGLSGWAAEGLNALLARARGEGPDTATARDALGLLLRLSAHERGDA